MQTINILKIENKFIFINQIPNESIGYFLKKTDALYLSLKKNKTFSKTIPGKLQTYMSISKPIISSISGETDKIINEAKCGLTSKAEDNNSLEVNIIKFLKMDKDKEIIYQKM